MRYTQIMYKPHTRLHGTKDLTYYVITFTRRKKECNRDENQFSLNTQI